MGKIKLTVAYDGTDFSGFQRQPGKRTVQGTLEKLLTRVTGESISVIGSGRQMRRKSMHWGKSFISKPRFRFRQSAGYVCSTLPSRGICW